MAIESVSAPFGYEAEISVDEDRTLGVTFLGQDVGRSGGLPFSPETNGNGDLAYAVSLANGPKGALSLADIYLNEELIAKDRPVLDLAMSQDTLAWLETGAAGSVLLRYDVRTSELTVEKLPIRAERLVSDGDRFVATGVASSGETVVVVLEDGEPAAITYLGDAAIFLAGDADGADLIRVTGDLSGQLLYAALDRFSRSGIEEFGQLDNDAGRLAWHQSYRLIAAADLAAATGDADLGARAVAAVMEILQSADAEGNYPSTRYSLGNEPIALSVNSAFIYHAAFASYQEMSPSQRQVLVEQAERSFASFESDWMSYGYRFTPGSDLYLDGVIQPFNMQSAMGLMALDLYRATGDEAYLSRADAIWDLIVSELVSEAGNTFWYYWPKLFRDGWSQGTFDSVNAATRAPTPATSYEDVYHAAVTIEFLLAAADAFERPDVIDPEALFQSVKLGPLDFAETLGGSSGGYQFLPPWPDAQALWPFLTRDLPSILARYDTGVFDWMYARAARQSGVQADTQIEITRLDPVTGQVVQTATLTGPDEILAFVQANAYAPEAQTGSIETGTAAADDYHGSPGNDAVRLLTGNDSAAMGDGDDVVMGDHGADSLSGQDGADSLFGGFGADQLSGGPGDDLLSGQAGDDALLGGDGSDTLIGGGGSDVIDGGLGFDIAVLGSRDGMELSYGPGGVVTVTGPDGTDTLTNIEQIRFSDAVKWSFGAPSGWTSAAPGPDGWHVGDFDGDGRSDVFRYVPGVSGADMFRSNGTSFDAHGSWTPAGSGSDGWYIGDFNGDGRDDLFRYLPGVSGADMFLSSGAHFGSAGSWTGAGNGTDGWYVGDFNGDGRDDVFRYLPGQSGADMFLSNGAGFVRAGSWTGAGNGTEGWYVGDFNGDGRDDIFRYLPGLSGADMFLSTGTGFVGAGSWTAAGNGSDDRWYVGDLNGDGSDDIFRYRAGASGADTFLSAGSLFVADGSWTAVGFGSGGWYTGDYNGDGTTDLLRVLTGGSEVLI